MIDVYELLVRQVMIVLKNLLMFVYVGIFVGSIGFDLVVQLMQQMFELWLNVWCGFVDLVCVVMVLVFVNLFVIFQFLMLFLFQMLLMFDFGVMVLLFVGLKLLVVVILFEWFQVLQVDYVCDCMMLMQQVVVVKFELLELKDCCFSGDVWKVFFVYVFVVVWYLFNVCYLQELVDVFQIDLKMCECICFMVQ